LRMEEGAVVTAGCLDAEKGNKPSSSCCSIYIVSA
jgi:hypothetical protein